MASRGRRPPGGVARDVHHQLVSGGSRAQREGREAGRLLVDERAVEVERQIDGHAGVGQRAISAEVDVREEQHVERVARAASRACLDRAPVLLDTRRFWLGGEVGRGVLARRQRAPVAAGEPGELLLVHHDHLEPAGVGRGEHVFGPGQRRRQPREGEADARLPGGHRHAPLELAAARRAAMVRGGDGREVGAAEHRPDIGGDAADVFELEIVEIAIETAGGVSEAEVRNEVLLSHRHRRRPRDVERCRSEAGEGVREIGPLGRVALERHLGEDRAGRIRHGCADRVRLARVEHDDGVVAPHFDLRRGDEGIGAVRRAADQRRDLVVARGHAVGERAAEERLRGDEDVSVIDVVDDAEIAEDLLAAPVEGFDRQRVELAGGLAGGDRSGDGDPIDAGEEAGAGRALLPRAPVRGQRLAEPSGVGAGLDALSVIEDRDGRKGCTRDRAAGGNDVERERGRGIRVPAGGQRCDVEQAEVERSAQVSGCIERDDEDVRADHQGLVARAGLRTGGGLEGHDRAAVVEIAERDPITGDERDQRR